RHLDEIGHTGPRILITADLGRVEWRDSLPTCERLAQALGLELVVVRRKAGDMMDRWQIRWNESVRRYQHLECVKLIMPWSGPALRFCPSELKVDPICSELVRRYPGRVILSVTGIRAEESTRRALSPVVKEQPKLYRVPRRGRSATRGYDWHPILHWPKSLVL